MTQLANTIVSNATDPIERRVARWLLMVRDPGCLGVRIGMVLDRTSSRAPPGGQVNLLLRSLSPGNLRLVSPHLERVCFGSGEILVSPEIAVSRMLFPETLLVGFCEGSPSSPGAQIGMVGREGIIGWPLLLGSEYSPLHGTAQLVGGTALAIDAKRLKQACGLSESLLQALLRFVHNFMTQLANTIVSNATDPIERRVARWLLMVRDRIDDDAFGLTHDHVSNALNVRRASVTDCFHILEGEGLLRCMRGRVVIRDRARLQQLAGVSYGKVEAHYARDIGPLASVS